jgi:hypothetical protein
VTAAARRNLRLVVAAERLPNCLKPGLKLALVEEQTEGGRMAIHGLGLNALIEVGRRHWRGAPAEEVQGLKKSGELEKEFRAAADLTLEVLWQIKF